MTVEQITLQEVVKNLRRAADGSISEEEFYKSFDPWRLQSKYPLVDLILREVEGHFASLTARNIFFIRTGAPKNIIELNRQRLRVLAKALEEGWDEERTEREVNEY